MCCQDRTSASSGALQVSPTNPICVRAAKNSDGQGPEVCPSRKAAGHFQTVTNSDLRLQTSHSDKGNRYRLRIGTFRVLFVLAEDMIQVYAVKDRKEAYE
jgi:hypothetical protein